MTLKAVYEKQEDLSASFHLW